MAQFMKIGAAARTAEHFATTGHALPKVREVRAVPFGDVYRSHEALGAEARGPAAGG